MGSEFMPVIVWYLLFLLIGWGSFPLSYTVFKSFPDRGFSLAKTQGLFLLSYLIWLSTSLGFTRYRSASVLGMFFLYLLLNGILLVIHFSEIWTYLKTHIRLLLGIEAIFLLFFLGGILIRMYNPELTGAEKEADFTLLNAILHSKTFPPKDTWFAGATINYYYFGYLIWTIAIKLTGIISPVGFNLALVTIMALSATAAFGLLYHFTRRVLSGLFSSVLLLVLGNLDGLAQLIERNGHPLPFNWWQSSRIIPDTINEFPFFSFLLGDLHAHFMSIPFVLLLLGLLSQLVFKIPSGPTLKKEREGLLLVLIGLSLGGMAIINTWDYPTSLLLTGFCLLIAAFRGLRPRLFGKWWLDSLVSALGLFLGLVILSRVAFLPFYQHFTPQLTLSHLRLVASNQRTHLGDFLVIHGLFLWMIALFVISRFRQWFNFTDDDDQERMRKLLVWNGIGLLFVSGYFLSNSWVFSLSCLAGGIFLWLLVQDHFINAQYSTTNPSPFPLPYLLVFMAFAMTAGCEILYIKDFYSHPLERQNTIFKFYYQVWIFLSIGTPYLLYRVSHHEWSDIQQYLKHIWISIFLLLCGACCLYPVFGTYERAVRFKGHAQGGALYLPTLNGISYIAYRYPFEYEALMWIQEHIDEDAVILEATGKPYSFFGRVATTTGRSTVLGWGNHEALWRDQTWKSIMQRTDDIKQIYEAVDKHTITNLLEQYEIEYIYVGKLEKESYASEGLKAFDDYFPVVFENALVRIYQRS